MLVDQNAEGAERGRSGPVEGKGNEGLGVGKKQ